MLPIFFVGMYWTPENIIWLGLWQHLQVGAALGVVGGVLLLEPALARGAPSTTYCIPQQMPSPFLLSHYSSAREVLLRTGAP